MKPDGTPVKTITNPVYEGGEEGDGGGREKGGETERLGMVLTVL
jgi:hypothetical protein